MSIFMIFRIALRALGRNKLRTTLTMLGMIIGVAAVITMVALGTGAQAAIEDQIRGAGTNMITVFPGSVSLNVMEVACAEPAANSRPPVMTTRRRNNGLMGTDPFFGPATAEATLAAVVQQCANQTPPHPYAARPHFWGDSERLP